MKKITKVNVQNNEHINKQLNRNQSEANSSFHRLDRRGSSRVSPPHSLYGQISLNGQDWRNIKIKEISTSGLCFTLKNSNGEKNSKAPFHVELFNESKAVFKGKVKAVWYKQDIFDEIMFGLRFHDVENFSSLFELINSWNDNLLISNNDRRKLVRRKNKPKTVDDIMAKESSRRIDRRLINRKSKFKLGERRVVIVGHGVIAPNAIGAKNFLKAIESGKSGVRPIKSFDASDLPCQLAGQALEFNPNEYINPKDAKRMDRATQMALSACVDALSQGDVNLNRLNRYRIGVIVGSSIAGLSWTMEQYPRFVKKGYKSIHPYTIAAASPNACSSEITSYFNIKGPSATFSQGCSSSASAIANSYDLIKSGKIDMAITGGADAPIIKSLFSAYCKSGMLASCTESSSNFPKPYDKNGKGTILGEGAGILILEDLETALAYKHNIYGELIGYASLTDGLGMMAQDSTGYEMSRAMSFALVDAEKEARDVSIIFGHGTGVLHNDDSEYKALRRVFPYILEDIPISDIKSMTGYTQGACSAIESIAACMAMNNNFIPPVINSTSTIGELNISKRSRKSNDINTAIVNSFGFGGKNISMLISKFLS